MSAPNLVVAILGAESTGKTTLAQALSVRIAEESGLSCTWVPEVLREWCDRAGRTPQRHEQAAISQQQHERIALAAEQHHVVISDTSALMTAVYSRIVFGDSSLFADAIRWHRTQVHHSLLTALDLPWVADGLQRDGPHVRQPVDATLREGLMSHALPWSLVSGERAARVECALDALSPLLRPLARRGSGLFSRLQSREQAHANWRWVCENCDVPDCEHALRYARGQQLPGPA